MKKKKLKAHRTNKQKRLYYRKNELMNNQDHIRDKNKFKKKQEFRKS
jgi:hypothetical protein